MPVAPKDPILGLNADFKADDSGQKVNLGVGAYRTETGKPYVLPVVRAVEQELANDPDSQHEYIPQDGLDLFCRKSAELILGADSVALAEGRVVTVQALSGTGALRLAFAFVNKFLSKETQVYLPSPTWSNHKNVVPEAGLPETKDYKYFNAKTGGVDIAGMLDDLKNIPAKSIVLLHGCAHNPTGADLAQVEWERVLEVVKKKELIPFFDSAYQGFASGDLEEDARSVRLFVNAGLEVLIAQSYAKNMGLYGERVGAFSIVCKNPEPTAAIRSQLKRIIRAMYSSPPLHGALVAAKILSDPKKFDEWKGELRLMSGRIKEMRHALKAELEQLNTPGTWDHITSQIGMFSFTGLRKEQVKFIRDKYHIYMTANGRISMAGLNKGNIKYVAGAIHDAVVSLP